MSYYIFWVVLYNVIIINHHSLKGYIHIQKENDEAKLLQVNFDVKIGFEIFSVLYEYGCRVFFTVKMSSCFQQYVNTVVHSCSIVILE